MRYWLVMPAAGASERFGGPTPKQYAPLAGRTVIEWALEPFLDDSRCAGAIVALAVQDRRFAEVAARLRAPTPAAAPLPTVTTCAGGAQRCLSVRSALAALATRAADDDWVLVHDAARPCLERADLERLLAALAAHPLGGLLAAPVADTLKRAQSGPGATLQTAQTVERSALWRALTPQMFRYRRLCAALDAAQAAGRCPSDEAQSLEWLGEQPLLIAGSPANLKITSAAELAVAAAILQTRRP